MSDFFFQIVLAAISVVVGISVPLLPTEHQKNAAKWFSISTIAIALLWAGYEWGARQSSSPPREGIVVTPSSSSTDTPFAPPPTATIQILPTVTPTFQLPERSLGHGQIVETGIGELILASNQVAIGTADKFQDVMQEVSPPFTIFVIYGEVNTQLRMYWGGWDLWENASDNFIEEQLHTKIQEVIGSHPTDYDKRGYRVIKCYGQVDNCETILTFP